MVRTVQIVDGPEGPVVEIAADRALVPEIAQIDDPLRLVIDLPGSIVTVRKQRISFNREQVSTVRVDQFQNKPPVTRVVVDLRGPVTWTWHGNGTRLMVNLRSGDEAPKPASVPALAKEAEPVAVPVAAPGAPGLMVETGSRVAAGSLITAAAETAVLRLARGGEVRVCPGSSITVTSSNDRRNLMLGMSTGSMEVHYALESSADSVMTPDFQILLPGPGEFHYAMSADPRGNTCVRSLPGNTASAVVSELMGDGTYKLAPGEQVMFRSGQITKHDEDVPLFCGCPPPRPATLVASAQPAQAAPESNVPSSMRLASQDDPPKPAEAPSPTSGLTSQNPTQVAVLALPPSPQPAAPVQVAAPLVFRAPDPPPAVPLREVSLLRSSYMPRPTELTVLTVPPPTRPGNDSKSLNQGFFGKLKGFFGGMFR